MTAYNGYHHAAAALGSDGTVYYLPRACWLGEQPQRVTGTVAGTIRGTKLYPAAKLETAEQSRLFRVLASSLHLSLSVE